MILTAESVIFTCCPPAPLALYVSILISDGSIFTSILSSTSGTTSTEAKEVCLFLLASKGDILTSLCTPFSLFRYPKAFIPSTIKVIDFIPTLSPGIKSISLILYFLSLHHLEYILYSISAQSQASVPPAPECIVTIALFESYSPSNRSLVSKCSTSFPKIRCFSSSSSWKSVSPCSTNSISTSSFSSSATKFLNSATSSFSPFISFIIAELVLLSFQKLSSIVFFSSSAILFSLFSKSKRPPNIFYLFFVFRKLSLYI